MIKADCRTHKCIVKETSDKSIKEEISVILEAVYQNNLLSRNELLNIVDKVLQNDNQKYRVAKDTNVDVRKINLNLENSKKIQAIIEELLSELNNN